MTLRLLSSHTVPMIKTSFGFQVGFTPVYGNDSSEVVAAQDLLLIALRDYGTNYCPSFARAVTDVFGFVGFNDRVETTLVSNEPETIPYDGELDDYWYGSIFRNIQLFGSTLTGRSFVSPSPHKEKGCRHSNFSGELVAEQVDIPLYYDDSFFHTLPCVVESTRNVCNYAVTVNSVLPLDLTPIATTISFTNVLSTLDALIRVGTYEHNVFGNPIVTTMSGVEYTVSYNGLYVRYHTHLFDLNTGHVYDWDSEIEVPFVDAPKSTSPTVGSTYTLPYTASCIFRYRNYVTTYPGFSSPSSREFVGSGPYRSFPSFMSWPVSAPSDSESGYGLYVASRLHVTCDNFRTDVERVFQHITPSSLFSTVAAFQNAEGYLGVNVLQNLAKIPDIVDALPQLKEAIHVLGRIARRDLSLSTLKEILDLATSTNLQSNFQWQPFIRLVTDYLPRMVATFDVLGLPAGTVIGYGSYRKALHNVLSRQEVTLQTRTKIVMDASPSGLLSAVLGVDALGLLPKASNLWDLIPFTFAVNWFSGIGGAIRRAETSLLIASVPAYFVHTYAITTPLREDELDLLKMSNSSVERSSLRLFYRDISLYTPPIRDSMFNFGIPDQLPPLGVIGSLLYQLIFG
jgi:hypothetical protein